MADGVFEGLFKRRGPVKRGGGCVKAVFIVVCAAAGTLVAVLGPVREVLF